MTTALTTRVSTDTTYAPTVKGSPLSSTEIDNNFISLATNKIETSLLDTTATNSTIVLRTSAGAINVKAIAATSLTLSATPLAVTSGGTGTASTPTSGQLLIGNSGGTYNIATLTGTSNQITITNTSGSIQIATPQDIASTSNPQFGSLGIGTTASGTSGELRTTGSITAFYSDQRLKENIQPISDALNKVMQISGVTYNGNQLAEKFGYTNKEKQVGVLSQQIEKVLPEAVKPAPFDLIKIQEGIEISKSGENYQTVQYEKLVPLLIEAIKELNLQVQELKGIK